MKIINVINANLSLIASGVQLKPGLRIRVLPLAVQRAGIGHMKYSKSNKFPTKIGVFHYSGIGDWLLLNPAIKEIKRRSPNTKIYIVTDRNLQYFLETDRNIDSYSLLPDYSIFKKNFRYDEEIFLFSFWGFFRITMCRQHQINLACKILGLDNCNTKPEIYLKREDESFGHSYAKLFKNRMITLCCDTSGRLKDWDIKRWEIVVKKCKGYMFVQIGGKSKNPIKGTCNMSGRTTLAQAMSLVKYSKLFVGIDGLFNHVANIFDIPKVILWGPGSPQNSGYSTNTINICKKLNCYPCFEFPTQKCQSKVAQGITQCMLAIEEYEITNAIKKMLREKYDPKIEYYKLKPVSKNICLDCNYKDICNIDFFKKRFSDLFLFKLI